MSTNLYSHKDSNIRKTWLLMTGFLAGIIALGYLLSLVLETPQILYGAVFLSIIMNFASYWWSAKIALAMSGARPINKNDNPYIYRMIENLCITAGLPVPKVYIISSPQINAFATGRNAEHAAIAVTEGAIEKLENEELEGVLAHELAHIGNRDILLQSVIVVLVGLVSILSDWFLRFGFHGGFGGRDDNRGSAGAILLVIALIAAVLAPFAAMLVQMAISRKREFLADATGSLLTRYPEGLARALEKIESDSMPARFAHNATAHLFISNPFKGKSATSWFARLFMTHPPLIERITALRGTSQIKQNPVV